MVMTQEEINQFAEKWAEQWANKSAVEESVPLPQILSQFGWDLQKQILEPLSDDILAT
jgi:hypothetical protein